MLNKFQKYFKIFNFKIFFISLTYFFVTLEKYSPFNFGFYGKIKYFHIIFIIIIFMSIKKIFEIKLNKIELYTLCIFILSIVLSLVYSLNFYKSILWTNNILIIIFGLLGLGIMLKPKISEILAGVTYGAIPCYTISYFELYNDIINKYVGWKNLYRIYGTAYEPGSLALMLFFPSVPFLIWMLNLGQKNIIKYNFSNWTIIFSLFALLMLFLSTGRSGWVCIPIFVFLYCLLNLNLKKITIVLFASLLFFLIIYKNENYFFLLTDYFYRNLTDDLRYIGFSKGLKIFLMYPIAGCGLGCFGMAVKEHFPLYWLQNLIKNNMSENDLMWSLTTYNVIVEQLVNFGSIGLMWFIFAFICLYLRCLKNIENMVIFIISVTALIALLFNQNIFRAYILFIPLIFFGSALKNRNVEDNKINFN